MALRAVVFDVGETLFDETGIWERAAAAAGVPHFTFMGILGGLAARGERHSKVWELLGVERSVSMFEPNELYPDALPCISALRSRDLRVGAVGNTPEAVEECLRAHMDFVGSSARWRVEKPARRFFQRVVEEAGVGPSEIAYVGDRVDNDVEPALAAGMVAVHVRRGPWGYLHDPPAQAISIHSLEELPAALGV
ncbi:MAG: HAD family hydrolase [Actinomycetota bacterium]|nr:HAD family hydrolase [Actinomycetota bacterium]